MRPHRHRRHTIPAPADTGLAPIVRLWILRMLVPLGSPRTSVDASSSFGDVVALSLGLQHLVADDASDVSSGTYRAALRSLHQKTELSAAKLAAPDQIATNVARLGELVSLTEVDKRILEFVVLLHSERILDDVADTLGSLHPTRVRQILAVVLKRPEAAIRAALDADGILARSGLMTLERFGNGSLKSMLKLVSDGLVDCIASPTADPISLLRDVVLRSSPGHLLIDDFEHLNPTLDLLRTYLRKAIESGREGVNILLYGPPGTGKNQLAKALATNLGCDLFEVSSEDRHGDPVDGWHRLRAYRAAQAALAQTRALLLFDEVQDVFDSGERRLIFDSKAANGNKAWINRALEGNKLPSLWLTNSVANVDNAHIRRFDMALEMSIPPKHQREKIIKGICGSMLDAEGLSRLARSEVLAPAVVARASSMVQFVGADLGTVASGDALQRLVNQTLAAQGHPSPEKADAGLLPEIYDPAFVNADVDLSVVSRGLVQAPAGRLFLFGPPGTGKTAWARWLSGQLGRPLLVRRASDLMSMWLGNNEKNIACAFRDAEEMGAVLLIDEVDSFLQDRRGAKQSWEVTLVNEMLTQMESFDGLFIATTNLMDDLDAAALRRFDLKVCFDFLRPDQAWTLLERHATAIGLPAPDSGLRAQLSRLGHLTPGDFAAVWRQHRFRPFACATAMVSALAHEVEMKRQGISRPIGFA